MMKDIPGYDGNYKINESGIVINKNGHVMRVAQSNSGYLRTALEIPGRPGERVNESIHRLVARTFLKNPDNLPVVMHLDNDKLNNQVSNLKYGTYEENIQQAIADGLWHPKQRFKTSSPKKNIYEIYNEDETDIIRCIGREEVADKIQYEMISLKNMVGNGRKIALGPYKDYMIRRTGKSIDTTFGNYIYDVESDVQRLSPNGRVKPQANGGGKIQPFDWDYFINKYGPSSIHIEPYEPKEGLTCPIKFH